MALLSLLMSPLSLPPVLTTWPPRELLEVCTLELLPPPSMALDMPLDSTAWSLTPMALLSLLMSPLLPLPVLTILPSREPSTKH